MEPHHVGGYAYQLHGGHALFHHDPYALGMHDPLGSHAILGALDGHLNHAPVDVRLLHLNFLMYIATFKDRISGPV